MATLMITYGIGLGLLSSLLRFRIPGLGNTAFLGILTGAALAVFFGTAAWLGYKRRVWLVLTLSALALVLLGETVNSWLAFLANSKPFTAALFLTISFLASLAALMYVLHGERPDDFYRAPTSHDALRQNRQEKPDHAVR